MKYIYILIMLTIYSIPSYGQTLGGYVLKGYLSSAVHPNSCNQGFVVGMPDDSIWVNFPDGDVITGNFSNFSIDSAGPDLLLETGYNTSFYIVSLLLSNGNYSIQHNVDTSDWQMIDSLHWEFLFTSCTYGSVVSKHLILPLDFNLDFGLTSNDTVIGIKIEFLSSVGVPDFAGAYILTSQEVGLNDFNFNLDNRVYPNPFTDRLTVKNNTNRKSTVKIYDINLNMLIQQPFINSITLETKMLAKGVYMVELLDESGSVRRGKFIKE